MRHFFKTFTWRDYLLVAICSIVYLCLVEQGVPFSYDEFHYRFNVNHSGAWQSIESFGEVFESNVAGYIKTNGRFLVHCFVQYFQSIGGAISYYIMSSLVFGLLLLSMIYMVRRNMSELRGDKLYVLYGLSYFMPLMGTLCYGTVPMTVNYMWSAAIYTFLLCIYIHIKNDNIQYSLWQNIIILIFGIICGSWQESFSIGIIGAMGLYHVFNWRNTSKTMRYLLIGLCIGAAILVLAPGNFVRLGRGVNYDASLGLFFIRLKQIVQNELFVTFWLIIGVISIIIDLIKYRKIHFIRDNWLLYASGLIAFVFTLYTLYKGVYQGVWQMTILSIWDTILAIRFMNFYFGGFLNKFTKYIIPILIIVLISTYMIVHHYRQIVQHDMQEFTEECIQNKPDTVYTSTLEHTIMKVPGSKYLYPKIAPMYISYIDPRLCNYMGRFYSYGKESWGKTVLFEPIEKLDEICIQNGVPYISPDKSYVVTRFHKDSVPEDFMYVTHYKLKTTYELLTGEVDPNNNKKTLRNWYSKKYIKPIITDEYEYYIRVIGRPYFHNKNIQKIVLEIKE